MNTIPEILGKLEIDGIRLSVKGDRLRVESVSPLPPEIRDSLKNRKQEILDYLVICKAPGNEHKPFLDGNNDLVIPFHSDPRFHWWKPEGMRISETKEEIRRNLVN